MMKRNKAPLGVRLNNPFNIRYSRHNKWLGQIGNVNGFCKFSLPYYGVRAFAVLYFAYLNSGRATISRFIRSYAPSAENDTESYIHSVCVLLGCSSSYCLSLKDFPKFAKAVLRVEIGEYCKQYYTLIDFYIK